MTRIDGKDLIIESEVDVECSRCGQVKGCRDVLGNGTQVCFSCSTEEEVESYLNRLNKSLGPGPIRFIVLPLPGNPN